MMMDKTIGLIFRVRYAKRVRNTSGSNLCQIRGLVFDLDGTLIHSTIDFPLMRHMMFARMRQSGIPGMMLDGNKSMASNLQACYRYLDEEGSKDASISLLSDAARIMNEIEMLKVWQTQAVPGVSEAICRLIDDGYSMAVLTRGSRGYTEAALTASGLIGYFANIVCRDDYPEEEAKPNPISLARAAGKLNVAKEKCLLVGDHEMDLECALSAGSSFVGVLSGATNMRTWTRLGDIMIIPDVSYLPDILTRN